MLAVDGAMILKVPYVHTIQYDPVHIHRTFAYLFPESDDPRCYGQQEAEGMGKCRRQIDQQ